MTSLVDRFLFDQSTSTIDSNNSNDDEECLNDVLYGGGLLTDDPDVVRVEPVDLYVDDPKVAECLCSVKCPEKYV